MLPLSLEKSAHQRLLCAELRAGDLGEGFVFAGDHKLRLRAFALAHLHAVHLAVRKADEEIAALAVGTIEVEIVHRGGEVVHLFRGVSCALKRASTSCASLPRDT